MHRPIMHPEAVPRRDHSRAPLIAALVAAGLAAACGAEGPVETPPVIPIPQVRDAGIPWQAEPIRLPDDQLAAAIRACQANQMIPLGAQIVLVDARGRGRATVLYTAPGPTSGDCVVEREDGGFHPRSGSAITGDPIGVVGPNDVQSDGVGVEGGQTINGLSAPPISSLSGRVGANVVAVQLVVAGRPILASTGNGWFAAWWPSADPPTGTIPIGADGRPLGPAGT
jgi:hypothetical protein